MDRRLLNPMCEKGTHLGVHLEPAHQPMPLFPYGAQYYQRADLTHVYVCGLRLLVVV